MTETVKLHCTEELRNAIAHAAAEAGKPVSETLRVASETLFFGHLYQLRAIRAISDLNPMDPPRVNVDQAISALAVSAGMTSEEYTHQVLTEHAFGLFHSQMMERTADLHQGHKRAS
jgi:hypothetical protein